MDAAGNTVKPGGFFAYAFDGIGNFTDATKQLGDVGTTPSSNALNQTTSETLPDATVVTGAKIATAVEASSA